MSHYSQFLFIIISLLFASCALTANAGEDPILTSNGNYVFPTTMSEIELQEPPSYDGLKEVPQCDLAKEKAVQNYNQYMSALGNVTDVKPDLIGETLFIKMSWCHYDVGNPSNFVVMAMTGTKQQVARDKEDGRISSGPMFITVFDENGDIIKWSY